jgi:hypothetical protein
MAEDIHPGHAPHTRYVTKLLLKYSFILKRNIVFNRIKWGSILKTKDAQKSFFFGTTLKLSWPRWRKTYIPVMRHTTSDNSSHSTLIAKSENMDRTFNDFRELLLLIHSDHGGQSCTVSNKTSSKI